MNRSVNFDIAVLAHRNIMSSLSKHERCVLFGTLRVESVVMVSLLAALNCGAIYAVIRKILSLPKKGPSLQPTYLAGDSQFMNI